MSITIYNSLSKRKEEFIPLHGKSVKMYCCGVTVYDECHIGHARSLYVFDVIRRYLHYRGYDVHFVRNITDIDDKIIQKAKELGKKSEEVAKENIVSYYRDLKSLAIELADVEPRASEDIPDMIQSIQDLIKEGYAYSVDGDVYYNVRKFKDYGKLSGQSIEKMLEAVRIEKDSKKKDSLDFALWKKSEEGEPYWQSPWGKGRPGWHIECSCMSLKHLKCDSLDIHAGGRDLIFPHHENEIAQAEPITKRPFAKYWIHHGLLTINGQKMAKSSGNFITIKAALQKYSVDDLKMFFLSSHYASPIDFSEDRMVDSRKALERFDILFWKAYEVMKDKKLIEPKDPGFISAYREDFLKAMDDDFNTPKALASLFELINEANKFMAQKERGSFYGNVVFHAVETIEDLAKNIFGLFLKEPERNLSPEEEGLLKERETARNKKDFKRSDELRQKLHEKGIVVEDTKTGQTWRWV